MPQTQLAWADKMEEMIASRQQVTFVMQQAIQEHSLFIQQSERFLLTDL